MNYTADLIANYIIADAHESQSFISNLKLQKLAYYAQAWHLAIYGTPLFPEKFQAWVHGPVIPSLYHRFKGYSWRNIDEDIVKPEVDAETTEFLTELLDEYGPLDARRLEWLTHREDPWLKARERGGVASDEPCYEELREEEMGEYYRQRMG